MVSAEAVEKKKTLLRFIIESSMQSGQEHVYLGERCICGGIYADEIQSIITMSYQTQYNNLCLNFFEFNNINDKSHIVIYQTQYNLVCFLQHKR